ncbi:hypothetical protein DEU56DRAFT_760253 [Suillus clintonianus]|uniref:uncharacterized protein n=1 Tax=Suillus clintonianus TaxID=1904413 RepID=UPI001B88374A|nr:uncharacterized protein DEU56DRAFT_760253 [Suillus clintonianus]KAG2122720.1 hypothetical protein DEU56DRAFT_760253 [Suillus clintonianus]
MARKGKKRAAEGDDEEGVAATRNGESSGVKLDSRPIEPAVPTDEAAEQIQRLDAAIERAKIGIGKINILKIDNELRFGKYNDRPERKSEINKMVTSFEAHGIQAFSQINALPIIIHRSRLSEEQTFEGEWNDPSKLEEVHIMDQEAIVFASGQHRVAALRKMQQRHFDEHMLYSQRLKELQQAGELTYRVKTEIGFKLVKKYLLVGWYISWRVLLGWI